MEEKIKVGSYTDQPRMNDVDMKWCDIPIRNFFRPCQPILGMWFSAFNSIGAVIVSTPRSLARFGPFFSHQIRYDMFFPKLFTYFIQEYSSCSTAPAVDGQVNPVAAVALFPQTGRVSVDPEVGDGFGLYSSVVESGHDDFAYVDP